MTDTRHVDTQAGTFTVTLSGDGPPLLNLHGLSGLGQRSLESSPSNFQVATFDQRGHGDGPRLQEAGTFEIDTFVADALAVLDALGWDQVAVAGQSMGAAVALRLAMDHTDRVAQLILAGPAFGAAVNPGAAGLGALAESLEQSDDMDTTIAGIRARLESEGMPRDVSAFIESFREHHFPSIAAAIREVMFWAPFADLSAAKDLGIPAVVLGWPDDDLHPWDLAEQVAEILSAPLGSVESVVVPLIDPGAIGVALDNLISGDVR